MGENRHAFHLAGRLVARVVMSALGHAAVLALHDLSVARCLRPGGWLDRLYWASLPWAGSWEYRDDGEGRWLLYPKAYWRARP